MIVGLKPNLMEKLISDVIPTWRYSDLNLTSALQVVK